MANAEKVAAVAELTGWFKDSSGAVLTEYRGLTVAQLAELRRSLGDNATFAVAGADKSVSIRNADKEIKKLALPAEAKAIAFAPNGATVVVGLTDNSVRLINVADGKELKNVPGHHVT